MKIDLMRPLSIAASQVFLLLLAAGVLHAQTTVVKGKVINVRTQEPVPYVNVSFKDSKIGTTTDMNGNFRVDTYYAKDTLVVSAIGFKKKKVVIQKDEVQEIEILLEEQSFDLEEVTVKPEEDQENPAHPIMRNVIEYKPVNDREKLKAYQYEVYNKVEFDLNNIPEDMREKKIFKPFDFVFDNIDSTGEKPFLPVFMTESLSDVYFRKNPKKKKEIVQATKVSGVKNKSVSQFLGDMYQNVNVYDNYIQIFNKNFVSPIADFGFGFYDYYLMDSAYVGDEYCYQIRFQPKRKQELTFEGDMWIHDTTYAVKNIQATVSGNANINFVNDLNVEQTYDQVEDEVWMLTHDHLVIDFNISDKAMGMFGRKTTTYGDFVINDPKPDEFYEGADNVVTAEDVNEKDEEFWEENRHEELSSKEKKVYAMVDTMQTIPQYRTYIDIIQMFVTGYKEWGYVELGPYFTTYSYNPVERHRFRLGARTSNQFSKRLMLEAYTAYGTGDRKFKYGGSFMCFLSKEPRQIIGGSYKKDVEQLGQSDNAFREDNILASFLRRNPANKLSMVREVKGYFEREWFEGFSNKLIFRRRELNPLGALVGGKNGEAVWGDGLSSITTADVGLYTRFAYNEKYVSGEFERVSLGTDYPVFEMQYTAGLKNLLNSDFDYHHLKTRVSQELMLGYLGRFDYLVEAGKIWGSLPYPLLEIHTGNATYFYDRMAFNMMNLFEFISDEYVSVGFVHHFDGLFLNRIPLMRQLKWREVVSAKGVIGNLNPKHRQQLELLKGMNTLTKPYMEVGVGIENIFKILRVDALWRLSYLNKPNVSPVGVRASLQLEF